MLLPVLNSQTFWVAVQAVATLLAFGAIWLQVRKAQAQIDVIRATTGYDILLRLDERFTSDRIRKRRRLAAQVLKEALGIHSEKSLESFWKENEGRVADVLDEFELIGFLIGKGVVVPKGVWSLFSYYVTNYHAYCMKSKYFQYMRRNDPSFYEEFHELNRSMQAIHDQRFGVQEQPDANFLELEGRDG